MRIDHLVVPIEHSRTPGQQQKDCQGERQDAGFHGQAPPMYLVPQFLIHQHNLAASHAPWLAPKNHQSIADAVRTGTVITLVRVKGAGGISLKAPGILGGGDVSGPPEGGVIVRGNFIFPDNQIDLVVTVNGRSRCRRC